jgi:hypothetical protein
MNRAFTFYSIVRLLASAASPALLCASPPNASAYCQKAFSVPPLRGRRVAYWWPHL